MTESTPNSDSDGFVTVIAGSRSITDASVVKQAIEDAPFEISAVVHGGADGVDTIAGEWAEENDIPVTVRRPKYDEYHEKQAPKERNKVMAEEAERAIIIWDGESRGTKHMMKHVKKRDVDFYLHRTDTSNLSDFM